MDRKTRLRITAFTRLAIEVEVEVRTQQRGRHTSVTVELRDPQNIDMGTW